MMVRVVVRFVGLGAVSGAMVSYAVSLGWMVAYGNDWDAGIPSGVSGPPHAS